MVNDRVGGSRSCRRFVFSASSWARATLSNSGFHGRGGIALSGRVRIVAADIGLASRPAR